MALHIDQHYCISLYGCEDRRELQIEEWAKLGMEPNYFLREKDREDPVRGCYESHRAVCRDALEKGYQTILVLEDDFKMLPFSDKQLDDANRVIDCGLLDEYDMLMLGHIPRRVHLSKYPGIAHVQANGTHAYILGPKAIARVAETPFSGQPIDTWYKANFSQLALFPMVCIQHGGLVVKSEITGGGDGMNKWPRRVRKQYIWAYFRYAHKSLANLWRRLLERRCR